VEFLKDIPLHPAEIMVEASKGHPLRLPHATIAEVVVLKGAITVIQGEEAQEARA
jgi:hypothetical protein